MTIPYDFESFCEQAKSDMWWQIEVPPELILSSTMFL